MCIHFLTPSVHIIWFVVPSSSVYISTLRRNVLPPSIGYTFPADGGQYVMLLTDFNITGGHSLENCNIGY